MSQQASTLSDKDGALKRALVLHGETSEEDDGQNTQDSGNLPSGELQSHFNLSNLDDSDSQSKGKRAVQGYEK